MLGYAEATIWLPVTLVERGEREVAFVQQVHTDHSNVACK
jgi:hypothetical protein